jgi:hypothetical protein
MIPPLTLGEIIINLKALMVLAGIRITEDMNPPDGEEIELNKSEPSIL